MALGRDEPFESWRPRSSVSKRLPKYGLPCCCELEEIRCLAAGPGECSLRLDAMSESAHEASSAVSSRTPSVGWRVIVRGAMKVLASVLRLERMGSYHVNHGPSVGNTIWPVFSG